jgi:precorrin-2 dehydrogenase/sirohydrochlorin ferrochelatase
MPGYPIFLNLTDRLVVVVGAGKVARRKVEMLLEGGARIRVIGPPTDERLEGRIDRKKVENEPRPYQRGDLEGAVLAFAATDNHEVNREVWEEARQSGIPVNVATDPELCDFTVPSMVRRGDLGIAVSTGASSPRLARRIREKLETEFGPEYESLLEILKQIRPRITSSNQNEKAKRELFDRLLDSEILDLIRDGKKEQAKALVERILCE